MLFWILGFVVIILAAFVIIKLSINTNSNPDSNLGILEHPSTFKKQDIEHVDNCLSNLNEDITINNDI